MKYFLCLFMVLLSVFVFCQSAFALTVENIRIGQHADKTRIVIEVDAAVDFQAFTLEGPNRLVIDLPSFVWQAPATLSQDKGSIVQSVRHGILSPDVSRIVFETKDNVSIINSFSLPKNSQTNNRIVIDVNQLAGVSAAPSPTIQKSTQSYAVRAPSPSPAAPRRKQVVVIDPGHGGQDPGAVSGKTYEKHIVLGLGKVLKKELEKTGKYTVHLTRSSDRFITLRNRVKFARSKNADLFVSIHADSIPKSSVRGASIYTLSERASDAQSAKLAASENKADLIHGIDLTHEDHDVAGILLDLVQRDTMNQSNFFAEKLVKSMKSTGIRTLENPHRSAGFAVLKSPGIPSILIEAGFVSNRQDAKLLQQKQYQEKMAKTIATGIDNYLSQIQKN